MFDTPPSTKPTLPILTQHCRFCNHLLLATTRSLSLLPRRKSPATDSALILPLEKLRSSSDEDQDPERELDDTPTQPGTSKSKSSASSSRAKHVTLLLSTTLPDRRATLIRREDGIEKRILLRCGRCRVVVGYYLDKVHWADAEKSQRQPGAGHGEDGDGEEERGEERPPAMYVLPGALVETEKMGGEGVGEEEWRGWVGDS